MKKLFIAAMMAVTVASMSTSCGNSTPKPNLKDDVDTMSYAMGLSQTQGLREYLAQMEIDTTYIDAFVKGLNDGANAGDDKKKAAYYAGINIGQQISNRMIKGINSEIFGDDSTKTISLKNFMAGFVTGATGKKGLMTLDQAQRVAQFKAMEIKTKNMEKTYGANKAAGEKFLKANAKKAGVKFGILKHPHITTGELYETDEDAWVDAAKKNVEALKEAGAKTVIIVNPHEYSYFIKEYPRYVGELPFDVVFITDYVNDLIKAGTIKFVKPYNKKVTFHDPCSLNKLCGNYKAPREIIAALPGTHAEIEDPVLQWKYCCGNGVSSAFRKALPDVSYKIGVRRLKHANDVGAEVLLVACPHCKDMFAETKTKSGINIEPVHILEVVAYCMGIEV